MLDSQWSIWHGIECDVDKAEGRARTPPWLRHDGLLCESVYSWHLNAHAHSVLVSFCLPRRGAAESKQLCTMGGRWDGLY